MTTDVTAPGRQLQVKDDEGLTLQQRALLEELGMHPGDWRQACKNAEVLPSLLQGWLARNPAFLAAYNGLIEAPLDIVKEQMEDTAHKAAAMYDEAVGAVKMVELDVACPKCQHEFSVVNPLPDWNTRLRSGDMAMQISGLKIDRKQIEQMNVNLTVEQSMALMSWRYSKQNGKPVTVKPSVLDELRRKGVLNDNPTSSDIIDVGESGVRSSD